MEVLTGTDGLPGPGAPGSVVSIGVFDGMHLGHRAILAANRRRAGELGAVPTVVTFRRHPKEVLLGRAPRTLTTLRHRLELFRRAGVGRTLVLSFDETLRQMPPEEFVHRICAEGLGARAFVLGFDSKFGRDRAGTAELVARLGFYVEVVPKVVVGDRAVSSTAIREAVELGDIDGAARMLGRPVSVFGEVVGGAKLGRKLGFPTANLDLHHELHPPPGVYAARARVVEPSSVTAIRSEHEAVVNIGFRPTVSGETPAAPLVEVHLFDFSGELYGLHLEVEFVAHIRPEQRFDGLDALRAQIERDAASAREILAKA
ncbi:MAG: bifunctional riboflavin kinase/FAD synthetase [Planctomycetes bacterium]|nr:bifunctional riboflavin kinase/FAD synthetase [Planctomycetota bacterium]MCB9903137.1 bifunctional riboflavin kinase/FAD synthetase [Planctomycetota bacterium]